MTKKIIQALRNLLLKIANGIRKEEYLYIEGILKKIQSSIRFGGQCPSCLRTFEIVVDITKPLTDKKQGSKAVHCPFCKRHPIIWWFSQYEITSAKHIKQ